MKRFLLAAVLICSVLVGFAQQRNLVSYDDLNYLLHNNIGKADTFFIAKGYTLIKQDIKKKTRIYGLKIPGGTYANFTLRNDGRRMYVEIETNEPEQYNLIYNSVSQYLNKEITTVDMQAFTVKDLGMIYVTFMDTAPYNPMRRTYTMQIVSEKGITSYN